MRMLKLLKKFQPKGEELPSKSNPNESKIFAAEISGNAPSIDLHGSDTQSAMHELDVFLHSVYAHGDDVAEVIHGRGAGILREAVRSFLSSMSIVEYYRGGTNPGVTYVVLKRRG